MKHRSDPVPQGAWYKKPLRIAALQCNFEKESLRVIDQWTAMGFNTEQLLHPMADLYSALYDPSIHEEPVRRYLAKAHRKGLRVILYLNIHILGPTIMHRKEEWSMRHPDGSILFHYDGVYPSICLNSSWREHFFATLDQVGRLEVDGIFLDGPIVMPCHCRHCRQRYREWFGLEREDSSKEWAFCARTQESFMAETHGRWHAQHTDRPIYQNLPLLHPARSYVDPRTILRYNDLAGTEGGFQHYGPARNAFLFKPSFTARLLEATAPAKPRIIFMAADHKPWGWWMHTPTETVQTIASCAANASSVWYGLHGSSQLLKTPSAAAAARTFHFLKEHERFYENTRSAARVGLLFSFASERAVSNARSTSDFLAAERAGAGAQPPAPRGDMEASVRGYYQMLVASRIPFDMVTDLEPELSHYRVLILPSCGALEPPMAKALRQYVHGGGTLIAQLDASLYDLDGQRLRNFALADVFGVRAAGECRKRNNWNYLQLTSPALQRAAGAELLPLPLTTVAVRAGSATHTLAWALADMPGRYTALQKPEHALLTEHRLGKGRCFYFAGAFGEMAYEYQPREYQRLLEALVRPAAGSMVEVDNAPALIEMVHRTQGGRHLLHLINFSTGSLRPFDAVTTARDVRFRLPKSVRASEVRSLALKAQLPLHDNAFVLPELREHDLVVIETPRSSHQQ